MVEWEKLTVMFFLYCDIVVLGASGGSAVGDGRWAAGRAGGHVTRYSQHFTKIMD